MTDRDLFVLSAQAGGARIPESTRVEAYVAVLGHVWSAFCNQWVCIAWSMLVGKE